MIVLISYLAYTKFANPFASKYTIHAIFSNANGLRPGSLVRIAGVNVGKVTERQAGHGLQGQRGRSRTGAQAADVTMTIDDQGFRSTRTPRSAIRPRIFLEGNFFVDVHPG